MKKILVLTAIVVLAVSSFVFAQKDQTAPAAANCPANASCTSCAGCTGCPAK